MRNHLLAVVSSVALAACGANTINTNVGPVIPAAVQQSVGAAGATVQTTDGSGVIIPAGALQSTVNITVTPTPSAATASNSTLVGTPYVFGPAGQTFGSPVTVTLAFDPTQLPTGVTASEIVIQTAINGTVFTPLPTVVSDATHVSAQASSFSTFEATIPDSTCGVVTGYPGNACTWSVAVGDTFPDISLAGGASLNFSATPVRDTTSNLATTFSYADLQALAAQGFRYAFLDISAVWCVHCNEEASTLPSQYVPTWLSEGGIVFSILVQSGNTDSQGVYPPATTADLDAWITHYGINYPMSLDTEQNMVTATGLNAWPANLIVRLSDMTVIDSVFGAGDSFYAEFSNQLLVCNTTADCWSGATCNQGQCQN